MTSVARSATSRSRAVILLRSALISWTTCITQGTQEAFGLWFAQLLPSSAKAITLLRSAFIPYTTYVQHRCTRRSAQWSTSQGHQLFPLSTSQIFSKEQVWEHVGGAAVLGHIFVKPLSGVHCILCRTFWAWRVSAERKVSSFRQMAPGFFTHGS